MRCISYSRNMPSVQISLASKLGLDRDDQNPEDWNDQEVRKDLVVPDPSDPSSDEGGDPRLNVPSPVSLPSSSEEEEEQEEQEDMEEDQEEQKEASRKRKRA